MAKKDFTKINTARVYDMIEEATAEDTAQGIIDAQAEQEEQVEKPKPRKERKTYTPEEARRIMNTLQTTGRKGVKLPRINLAFTPELHDYITIMSRARGENLTQFVNKIIKEHMEQHIDIYKKALEFISSL